MTKFITLTSAAPNCASVRVAVDKINSYQEAKAEDASDGSAISLGLDRSSTFLVVRENPNEIDQKITYGPFIELYVPSPRV